MERSFRPGLLGIHPVQFHAPGHAFDVTTLTYHRDAYRHHLNALLAHADLRAIQWINLTHSRAEISTLRKNGYANSDTIYEVDNAFQPSALVSCCVSDKMTLSRAAERIMT